MDQEQNPDVAFPQAEAKRRAAAFRNQCIKDAEIKIVAEVPPDSCAKSFEMCAKAMEAIPGTLYYGALESVYYSALSWWIALHENMIVGVLTEKLKLYDFSTTDQRLKNEVASYTQGLQDEVARRTLAQMEKKESPDA